MLEEFADRGDCLWPGGLEGLETDESNVLGGARKESHRAFNGFGIGFGNPRLESLRGDSVDGSREGKTGPSWLGLFGSERKLTNGQVVIADEAYLRESILNPAAKVAQGAVNGEAGMPIYDGVLSEEQIASIILYGRSLAK